MSDENPFSDFWERQKGRFSQVKQEKGKPNRVQVRLSEEEMVELMFMKEVYPKVDSTIEQVTGLEVQFRVQDSIKLAKKSNI